LEAWLKAVLLFFVMRIEQLKHLYFTYMSVYILDQSVYKK